MACGLACGACGGNTAPARIVALPATAAAAATATAASAIAPPSLAARTIQRLAPLHVSVSSAARPTTRRLPIHGSSGATMAPDGETMFVDGEQHGTPGGFILSKARPQGVFFGTSEVHDARFSADGKMLVVYNDEIDVASVLSVPDGAVLQDVHHVKVARFDAQGALLVWDGCQLTRRSVAGAGGDALAVGPKLCGGADASDDGRTWVVVEPEPHGRPLARRDYRRLTWIDASTGVARPVLSTSEGFGEVYLAPHKGDAVCTSEPRLRCFALAAGRAEPIALPRLDASRLRWDDSGPRFVAASFDFSDIEVVDLEAATVQQVDLGSLTSAGGGIRYLGLLPKGKRLFAYDKGAWVIDLASGRAIEVFPKSVEVGGFVPVPGRDDRFLMGNEVGASRVYFAVDLPSP